MAATRVLIVEDSATVRARLRSVLGADPALEVVGEATDGKQAIALCEALRPDVITMDMMLPVMSGLAATEYVMAHQPTPILIVSSSFNRGEVFKTYDALAAGAVDVLEKPDGGESDGAWDHRFVAAVKMVARIRVITHPRGRLESMSRPRTGKAATSVAGRDGRPFAVAALGASTGGPGAIVEVIRGLPGSFRLPVLVVLHISDPFGPAFADWLDGQTERPARLASDGERVASAEGSVLLAPPDRHLVVDGGTIRLTEGPERHSCRPSVDVLFESLARAYGPAAAGCLLTGMGADGAVGLLAMRRAGGLTIAQDEATSVVYGMPGEAVRLDAAEHVWPLGEIGTTLATVTGYQRGERP